ncbi:NAD(P)H-dependent oxidoreductase [Rhizobiaceae bacterium BDR2-2]|uniref:NAD(P)H-dependent oxidoreductase n=1 Tax=Ectorhizobium quercum TaxID=2965071 RepID=A0AAE3N3X6_9HYPH|nr:NADPH-dependent FMN reductase [Ectorhizobium quercum]MCX8999522.1 NAD(P)H-dependent oxidoreductase [Ectorhizobium quercum]
MIRIAAISGSLRKASLNTSLLRACIANAPEGTEISVGSLRGIPLYDGDLETAEGLPPAVVALKTLIRETDGLLIVTPEYNNSMPGVLKNAIDWASRGGDMKAVFGGKPVAVAGASPGGFGTVLSQTAWLPVLKTLGAVQWSGAKLLVSRADTLFDAAGKLTDEKTKENVQAFLAGFADFVRAGAGK